VFGTSLVESVYFSFSLFLSFSSGFIDLIATDAAASDISDKIKEVLFNKAATGIENIRPEVANSMFNGELDTETEE